MKVKERPAVRTNRKDLVICSDKDADCEYVENKLSCFAYDSIKGIYPYLSKEQR